MSVLQQLLGEMSVGVFIRHYYRHQPFALPDSANLYKDLISWGLLEEIFSNQHKDCWLPKRGLLPQDGHLASGLLNISRARQGFSNGHTVLVRHAEKAQKQLKAIADDFYGLLQKPIDIQVYCTPKDEEGFDWHYDVEDVFVIQSAGEKEFRLVSNTIIPRPLPMMTPELRMRFYEELRTTEIRCWLKAGDWLYIPAGYWHKARAVTDSFHMSIGVLN